MSKCPKCSCSVHEAVNKNEVKCLNCGHQWRVMSEADKRQLEAFVEKIVKRLKNPDDDEGPQGRPQPEAH
jgi:uncharacterized Zn finger protein